MASFRDPVMAHAAARAATQRLGVEHGVEYHPLRLIPHKVVPVSKGHKPKRRRLW